MALVSPSWMVTVVYHLSCYIPVTIYVNLGGSREEREVGRRGQEEREWEGKTGMVGRWVSHFTSYVLVRTHPPAN